MKVRPFSKLIIIEGEGWVKVKVEGAVESKGVLSIGQIIVD